MPSSQLESIRKEKAKEYHSQQSKHATNSPDETTPTTSKSKSLFTEQKKVPTIHSLPNKQVPQESSPTTEYILPHLDDPFPYTPTAILLYSGLEYLYHRFYHSNSTPHLSQPLTENIPYFTAAAVATQLGLYYYSKTKHCHQQWLQHYGMNRYQFSFRKEYYRLGTSMLLHTNRTHLFNNTLAHKMVWDVEREYGTLWTMYLYCTSHLGAAALSNHLSPPDVLQYGVGSSGALFGFVGYNMLEALFRQKYSNVLLSVFTVGLSLPMVQKVMPFLSSTVPVDHAAHCGGLAVGIIQFFLNNMLGRNREPLL